jgi:uncharacterized protein (TIGR01319 family)
MTVAVLIDFGSTYTKVVAVDMDGGRFLGRAQAPTTVATDIVTGLSSALNALERDTGIDASRASLRLACSSAAGGLRVAAIGLVPSLTSEAAHRAALGAGAKVIRVFSHELTVEEVSELEALAPDVVLLAGGTDGGNRTVIVKNARHLAESNLACPIVSAGNKNATATVRGILTAAGKLLIAAENVMPELNELRVESARAALRDVFIKRIVQAKGLDKAQDLVDAIVMPTPMAVLEAGRLLADGTVGSDGLGDVVLVDVGGATTDVHSIAEGAPSAAGMIVKGLPEPHAKRTVEGDLGVRINAQSIISAALASKSLDPALRERLATPAAAEWAARVRGETERIPSCAAEASLDRDIGRAAVQLAMERHAGTVTTLYTSDGMAAALTGKDLREVQTLVGIGGVFVHGRNAAAQISGALFRDDQPQSLRPRSPTLYVDRRYVMYAAGLLARVDAPTALALMKNSLEPIASCEEAP